MSFSIFACLLFFLGDEPSHEAIRFWVKSLNSRDPILRVEAIDAIGEIGPAAKSAVPMLVEALKDENESIRKGASDSLGKMGPSALAATDALSKLLNDENLDVRISGIHALGRIGPGANSAVPSLRKTLMDDAPRVQVLAASALWEIEANSEGIMDVLSSGLSAADADVRTSAGNVLAKMGRHAQGTEQVLSVALNDESAEVRVAAADAIWKVTGMTDRSVPVLEDALKHDSRVLRIRAAATLWQMNGNSAAVLPVVLESLSNGDKSAKKDALRLIGTIGPRAQDAVPFLMAAFEDREIRNERRLSEEVSKCLGKIGRAAVPQLIDAVKEPGNYLRSWGACDAIAAIGPEAQPAVQPLIEGLRKVSRTDYIFHERASLALASIGSNDEAFVRDLLELLGDQPAQAGVAEALAKYGLPVVPQLIELLRDGDALRQSGAALALGKIGPDAKEAVPELSAALKHRIIGVRLRAAQALGRMGSESSDVIPDLIIVLRDKNESVRREASIALGRIGPSAVPALAITLKENDRILRRNSLDALAAIGPEAKAAVPDIIPLFRDSTLRTAVIYTVRSIGPAGIPQLRAALKDADPLIRSGGAELLGDFGPAANDTLPDLKRLEMDKDRGTRRIAAEAIRKIKSQAAGGTPDSN